MSLTFFGILFPRDGYGYAGIKTAEALRASGDVLVKDMRVTDDDWPLPGDCGWDGGDTAVALCLPRWYPDIKAERLIGFTMCETTVLPGDRAELINQYTTDLIVPSEWNKEVHRAAGVTVPIHVAPLGVDTAEFRLLDRTRDDERPYTFLWTGTPDMRKGWDVAYLAFRQAFGDRTDVQLHLHFRAMPRGVTRFRDKNVHATSGEITQAQVLQLYRRADCYVFPSRGEGWGLTAREAAATGLPVMATNWSGLTVDINEWAMPLNVAGMSQAHYGPWQEGEIGEWAEPDVDHLTELMQMAVEYPAQTAWFGERAAGWLSDNGGWDKTAAAVWAAVGAMVRAS